MGNLKNSVQLIGRPGQDPEIKIIGVDSRKKAWFSLAVNESYYNDRHELIEETQWISVTAFGYIAERVERLVRKGKRIIVDGHLNTYSYDDKNDNTKRYVTDVVMDNFFIIDYASTDDEQNKSTE